jgi:hypothetical protein
MLNATELVEKFASAPTQRKREDLIKETLDSNSIPEFLYLLKPIHVTDGESNLELFVMPDFLCVGTNEDYIQIPMSPLTCSDFLVKNNFLLPTPKLAKEIWKQAKIKLRPVSWPELFNGKEKKYNRDSTKCYEAHSSKIKSMLASQSDFSLGDLVAGHKKDVVLTNGLLQQKNKGNVAIYGWFNADGTPIQPLNPSSHTVSYVDYSHGLRMIKNDCLLNGEPAKLTEILSDNSLCKLAHNEPLNFLKY